MQKTTIIVLFFLLNFSFLKANNSNVFSNPNFNVSFSLTGEVLVEFYGYQPKTTFNWEIEYGPEGFQTGQGTTKSVSAISFTKFKLNPFQKYDFRIRSNEWVGTQLVWTNWSETLTVSSSNTYNLVGYTNDFNNRNEGQSEWKGVIYDNSEAQSYFYMPENDSHGNDTGSSVTITNSYRKSIAFVSPKFKDLATDLKINFWVRNLNAGEELLVGTMSDPNNLATFHLLSEVAVVDPVINWEKKTVYFNNYKGNDQYVVFLFKSTTTTNNYAYISLDDISGEKSINCFDQTNLTISNIGEKTAQFNFTAPNQNNFEISLKDITSGKVELYKTQNDSFLLTNLSGNTEYEVKVRSNCIDDLYSNWISVKFKTVCETIADSYSTSFEGPDYINPCWSTITNKTTIAKGSISWPDMPLPKTGEKMIIMYGSNEADQKSYLISPYINDLTTANRIRFSLIAYGRNNYNTNTLTIGTMSDPKDASTFVALKTILASEMNETNGFNKSSFWKEHTVYFDAYKNSNNHHYIALKQNNISNSIFSIDDFIFEKAPLCNEPLNPRVLSFDFDFATIAWDNYKIATEWQVEYGPKGFVHGSGNIVKATSSSIKLTDFIVDNTEYDFYIRTKCASGYSDWSDKGYFKTKCSGVTAGFKEEFENAVFDKNGCWTRLFPKINDRFWRPDIFIAVKTKEIYLPTVHKGAYSVAMFNELDANYVPVSESISKEIMLVSPRLKDLDNYKKITFWLLILKEQNNGLDKEIEIGTLSNANDFKSFTPYNVLKIPIKNVTGEWVKYEVDFSDYYGTDKYIGIRQKESNGRIRIYFDDFEYLQNDCPKPTSLSAGQIATDTVSLEWKDNNGKKQTEGWEIEYGPIGFADGTGTVAVAKTNPFSLSNLTLNTNYEYKVKANCEANSASIQSDRYPFKFVCSQKAPFTETFDQLSDFNLENLCWTTNKSQTGIYLGRIVKYSLNNINSSPNAFLLYNGGVLISPFFSDFDSSKKIKFKIFTSSAINNNVAKIIVGTIKNPADISTFEAYKTVSVLNLPKNGKEFEINFEQYKGSNKQIAFKFENIESGSDVIYIDDFYYGEKKTCSEPVDVVFSNINNNSANIKWTFSEQVQQNTQVEYGIKGFSPGNGIVLTTDKNEIAISNLEKGTSYEFYFKTICNPENSIVVGPYKIETSCEVKSLPWIEKFANVSSYGPNIVPDCFKLLSGNLTLRNASIKLTGYEPDRIRTGYDDTKFMEINSSSTTKLTTPIFHLNAGTTYKLALKARKGYEYSGYTILVAVGRGQEIYNMESDLTNVGRLTEFNYSDVSYYYTPFVSGDYSFLIDFNGQGGTASFLADNFEVKEGYENIINGNKVKSKFDFTVVPDVLNLEGTIYSNIELEDAQWIKMSGSSRPDKWVENYTSNTNKNVEASLSVWEVNQNNVTKINVKVDAQKTTTLFMSFDLKQSYIANSKESLFRVVVNGNVLGEVIQPTSSTRNIFKTYMFDLTPYVGTDIRISLQHIGKSNLGDNAVLDNLVFANTVENLSVLENNFTNFKYYPNPVENVLNIEGNSIISNVEIYNLNGQLVDSKKYSDSKIVIDFKHYAKGVYIIVLTKDEKKEFFKIIKK
nr:T9SS type A sorting domain-containing protein [uncultured Flavobacterium sp.]